MPLIVIEAVLRYCEGREPEDVFVTHLGILVLEAAAVYPESFIILILFCIYRVSFVRPYFPSLQQWFYCMARQQEQTMAAFIPPESLPGHYCIVRCKTW